METKIDRIVIELHTHTHTSSTLNTKNKKEIEKNLRNGKIDTS